MVGSVSYNIWYRQRNTHLEVVSVTYCHYACCNSMVSYIIWCCNSCTFSFHCCRKFSKEEEADERVEQEMIRWGERMTRGAASLSSVMTSCRHSSAPSFNYIPEK